MQVESLQSLDGRWCTNIVEWPCTENSRMQVIEIEVTDDNCLRVKIGRLQVVPNDSPLNWMNWKKSSFAQAER